MQNDEVNTMEVNKEVSDEPTTEPKNEATQEAIEEYACTYGDHSRLLF